MSKTKVQSMPAKKKTIAFIPARGGSKGIKLKNITALKGKPLIAYTIEAAIKSKLFSDIIVSTEDQNIAKVAIQYGASILNRPGEIASDNSTTDEVISHLIANTKLTDTDVIFLLQATSPLRNYSHILECWKVFHENKNHPTYSMCLATAPPQKAYCLNKNGTASPLLSNGEAFKPRQSLAPCAYPNGAIYIFTVADFSLQKILPRDQVFPYIMDPKSSIDIDTPKDINFAELYLND